MKLLLIEDELRFAQWVSAVVLAHWPQAQIVLAHDLAQARATLAQAESRSWQLAIVDLNLGDDCGIELIHGLVTRWPLMPVLVVTAVDDPGRALKAIRAGAQGYILKTTIDSELLRVVQQVLDGGSPISPSIARQLLSEFRTANSTQPDRPVSEAVLEKLTARETEVLRLLARGYTDKEVAADLTISPATVDAHVRKIYRKLNINSRVQLRRLLG